MLNTVVIEEESDEAAIVHARRIDIGSIGTGFVVWHDDRIIHRHRREASYRIVSQADGAVAVERTEPGKEPVISGHFKTETDARAYVVDLKKMAPQDRD